MDYEQDIGKFVTLSYRKPDGYPKLVRGVLSIDDNGFLKFTNVNDTNNFKLVNPDEIVVIDYGAEAVNTKGSKQ